jgi:raffinose/stachyose/melibiose transport system permease protein
VVVAAGSRVRRTRFSSRIGRLVLLGVWALVVIIPFYYLIISSFRSQGSYLTDNPWRPTGQFTLDQYRLVFKSGFVTDLFHSVVVAVGAVVITLSVSVVAAQRIVLNRTNIGKGVFKYVLIGLAVPLQALMIPIFVVIDRIGLYDTLWALVLVGAAFGIPVSLLVLVNFLRDVPTELSDAMFVDGATDMAVLRKLHIPLARPALLMLAVYQGLINWNNFVLPLILTTSASARVLPLQLFSFETEFGVNVPGVLAAVVLATLPMVLVFIVGYRFLVRGLAAGLGAGGAAR